MPKSRSAKVESVKIPTRVPIVTILGHVDHGKTSLLDKIREADVAAHEAGGITQKISVFSITLDRAGVQKKLTFIDTPGHEAFDLMRTRGGQIADIVLLIVAGDDGIMPQTEESIEIIKSASAKPIVVVTKSDLPNINLEKIKRDLSTKGILVEGYGGSVPFVQVSSKTGEGIENLLDTIDLLIEVEGVVDRGELPEGCVGRSYVLESVKDKTKGYVSSLVVVQGYFDRGGWIAYRSKNSVVVEKIKGFISETGENIEKLDAGYGGKVLGLSALLDLGSEVYVLSENKKTLAEQLVAPKIEPIQAEVMVAEGVPAESQNNEILAAMFGTPAQTSEEGGHLNVIVKSSSEGSLQAIHKALEAMEIENYRVNLIATAVGEITMQDIEKAEITKSIILGFEVNIDPTAKSEAEKRKVPIRTYEVVYKLIEEVQDALTVMSSPKESEEELGYAEIRAIFSMSDGSKVYGGRVKSGIIKRGERCYLVRNDEIVGEGKILSLRHNKDTINEAQNGADFGAVIEPAPDAQEGDILHCFKVVK